MTVNYYASLFILSCFSLLVIPLCSVMPWRLSSKMGSMNSKKKPRFVDVKALKSKKNVDVKALKGSKNRKKSVDVKALKGSMNSKKNVDVKSLRRVQMYGGEGLWKGFDPYSHSLRDRALYNSGIGSEGLGKIGYQWTEILSLEPRAFLYHNFLSKEECEYLIKLATPCMSKSRVIDPITGTRYYSSTRTSTGTSLKRGRDEIIRDIEKRIADFTFIPVEHGAGLHVLHYEVGQKIGPHYDFLPQVSLKSGGQRIATVLMYLSDVEEGGETVFPEAKRNKLSECGKKGLSVKPKMGDALLFWNMKPDGTLDKSSKHAGCPVIKGNKWSCTQWLHVNESKV